MIFYSLGNFIFDTDYQRSQNNTEYGILLKLNITKDNITFESCGIKIDRRLEKIVSCPEPEIFCDICEEEYYKNMPFAAKVFLEVTKKQKR